MANPPQLQELRQAVQIRLLEAAHARPDGRRNLDPSEIDAELNRQLDLWTRDNDVVQISLISDILAGSNPQTLIPPGGYQLGKILKALIRQNGITIMDLVVKTPQQMYDLFIDWPDTSTNASMPEYLILDFNPNANAKILTQSAWLWPGPNLSLTSAGALASGTVTIAGTIHTGDIVTVTVAGTAVSYTVLGGDTATTIATSLTTSLNANATVNATYSASSTAGVITITALKVGSANNQSLTAAVTGAGATTTATASGTTLTGGGDPNGGLVLTCKAVTDGLLKQDTDQIPVQAMYAKEELIERTCAHLMIRRRQMDLGQYHEGEAKRERNTSRRQQILGRGSVGSTRCYWN